MVWFWHGSACREAVEYCVFVSWHRNQGWTRSKEKIKNYESIYYRYCTNKFLGFISLHYVSNGRFIFDIPQFPSAFCCSLNVVRIYPEFSEFHSFQSYLLWWTLSHFVSRIIFQSQYLISSQRKTCLFLTKSLVFECRIISQFTYLIIPVSLQVLHFLVSFQIRIQHYLRLYHQTLHYRLFRLEFLVSFQLYVHPVLYVHPITRNFTFIFSFC